MYCAACGAQSRDDARVCDSCGAALGDAAPAAAAPPRTSRMAVAALILGIASPFTCAITALPAIVLGIVSLVQISQAGGRLKGKGLAIAGICVAPIAAGLLFIAAVAHNFAQQESRARVIVTKALLKEMHVAVRQFYLDAGRYPTEEEGLYALIERPVDVQNWPSGGYLQITELPKDGWGNDFIYRVRPDSSTPFVIISLGADGLEGGDGDDVDLLSNAL